MLKATLARRYIIFSSLLILATSVSLSLFMLAREHKNEERKIRERGISLTRSLAQNAELGVLTRNPEMLGELATLLLQEGDILSVVICDIDGKALLETHASEDWRRPSAAGDPERHGVGQATAVITPLNHGHSKKPEAYEVAYPVFTQREAPHDTESLLFEPEPDDARLEPIGEARVTVSLATMQQDLAEMWSALGLLTSLVIVVALLLTVVMARRIVRPLKALATAANEIAEGRLGQVALEASEDEIGQLATSFNRMTEELGRSREQLENYNARLEEEVQFRTEELKATQSQLVQAEKMSAVGLLVSGVAHELNNPLAGVIGFSQLLLMSGVDAKTRRKLESIDRDAQRCRKIVENLQTFAREHKPEVEYLGINGILHQTLELHSYQLRVDNVEIVKDFEAELPKTLGDFHQLQRVFLNVIMNAHQAIASRGRGGKIRITTRSYGRQLVVRFHDSGPGIAEENLGRLFDPFFTTKEIGHGTGLGLSICYGIVQEHGGALSAANNPEGGAVFTVTLPIRQPETEEQLSVEQDESVGSSSAARKNILVVDDESAIREILYELFHDQGHRVDTAVNGDVAWDKIQRETYDVIISDMRMPGMNGQELYGRIRELSEELAGRVIFSTGDVLTHETSEFLDGTGNAYVQKPFDLEAMSEVVNDLIEPDRHSPAASGADGV